MKTILDYKDLETRASDRLDDIRKAIKSNDARTLRDLCASSLICGDETIVKDKALYPVLDARQSFRYKGYRFTLSYCENEDRYVTWMESNRDNDNYTLEMYLARNPDETKEHNCWSPALILVPDAWLWCSSLDLQEGETVNGYILYAIDKYLDLNEPTESNLMLDTFVLMIIAQYSYTSLGLDEDGWDQSLQMKAVLTKLKAQGITLKDIEQRIKDRDFTDALTNIGSGNRERGFVMDYIEEMYSDIE